MALRAILPGHLRGLKPGQPSGRGQSLAYYLPTTEVNVMWFVAVLLAAAPEASQPGSTDHFSGSVPGPISA